MAAGRYEQLDIDDVQNAELGRVYSSLKKPGSLSLWFNAEMVWEATPSGRRGWQQTCSDVAIQTCLPLKVLCGLPLRQTTGFLEKLLERDGLDWSVPDFGTLYRRLRSLSIAIPHEGSAGPLHLLVDSTGIKAVGEGEWNARRHGGPKRCLRREVHFGIDAETLEIRANATMRLQHALPMRSSRRTKPPRCESRIRPEREPATKPPAKSV